MSLDVSLLSPDRIAELATRAGLVAHGPLVRERENTRAQHACLLLRKPITSSPSTVVLPSTDV